MNTTDLAVAYKLRHALDENVANLPATVIERLESARTAALLRKKPAAQIQVVLATQSASGAHAPSSSPDHRLAWLGRMGFAIPLAALVFGLIGIYQYEQHQQIVEAAYIDAEMLTDDLPLSAYLDNGFDAYLINNSGGK